MWKPTIVILILVVILLMPTAAQATMWSDDISDGISDGLDKYDFSEWDNSFYDSGANEVTETQKARSLLEKYLNGESVAEPKNVFEFALNAFKSGITKSIWIMLAVTAIAIISGLCSALIPDDNNSLREVAAVVISTAAIGVIISAFSVSVSLAKTAIDSMAAFCEISLPILSLMLTASGAVASNGVLSVMMAFLSTFVTSAVKTTVIPLTLSGGVIAIIGSISGRAQLGKLFGFIKTAIKWTVGVISTLYFGIVMVKGLAAASHDSISLKTAKYLLDKTVPIAGSMVSGTMDTATACAALISSAAGITAMVIVVFIAASPLVQLACANLTYRLTAAITEPISDDRIPKMLTNLAEMISCLFAAVAVVGVMFIITVAICVATIRGV